MTIFVQDYGIVSASHFHSSVQGNGQLLEKFISITRNYQFMVLTSFIEQDYGTFYAHTANTASFSITL